MPWPGSLFALDDRHIRGGCVAVTAMNKGLRHEAFRTMGGSNRTDIDGLVDSLAF
jgi:hypothetical protein